VILGVGALPFWSALTCQRFGTRRLVAARPALATIWPRLVAAYESGNKLPHSKFAVCERFAYNLGATLWSALTCQRFGTRRLVAARPALATIWPRQVAAYESGNKLPHSKFAVCERFAYNVGATLSSALTCQRFGTRRLVAARPALATIWPRQVAAYESGNKLPHSKFAVCERFAQPI